MEKPENALPFSFADDEGSNNSGFYDLQVKELDTLSLTDTGG